jgi:DNA-binding transcriptional LysR family regulator
MGMAMELRHLRYFLAVAEHGHLTRAAERLGIQQPPLSRAIKNLETEIGERLFFRTPHGVELTEAGTAFYSGASSILKDLERIVELTRSTARGEQGRIRVGLTPTGAFVPFVPECLAAFRGLYPAVSLAIEETLSGQLIEGLQSGKIDAAFMWTPHAEGLLKIPVFEDVLLVALPSAHPLATSYVSRPIPINLLAKETFIVYGRKDGFGLYAATLVTCREAGFSPMFGEEAPRLASALALVAAGLGIVLLPASVQNVRVSGIVYRPLKAKSKPRSVLSLVSRRNDRSAVVRNFVAFCRQRKSPEASG